MAQPTKQINAFTAQPTPANGDLLLIQQASDNAYRRTTLQNVIATIGIVVDVTPVLGGNLDTGGFTISDSFGDVTLDDNLVVTNGDILLDNSEWLRWEDSIGTPTLIMTLNINDDFTFANMNSLQVASTFIVGVTVATPTMQLLASGGGTYLFVNLGGAAGDLRIRGNASKELLAFTQVGDVLLGTLTAPSANSGKILVFGDNTADPTMGANTAGVYGKDVAGTVELFGVDEGGVASQLTSHYQPPGKPMYPDVNMPTHTISSYCLYTGEKITYDLHALSKVVETLTGEKIIYRETLSEIRDWDADQVEKVAKRETEIMEWEAMDEEEKENVDAPEVLIAKPKPEWMKV